MSKRAIVAVKRVLDYTLTPRIANGAINNTGLKVGRGRAPRRSATFFARR